MIELIQKIDHGALPCPTESDKSRNLPIGNGEADIGEGFRSVAIGEVDILHDEVTTHRLGSEAAGIFYLVICLEDAKEAFCVDKGIVQVVIDAVKLADGCTDIGEEHHMIHNLTNGHARIVDEYEIGGQNDDEHGAYLLQEALQSVEHKALAACTELLTCQAVLNGCLTVGLYLLTIERLDDGDALDDVQNALTDGLMAGEDAATTAFHTFRLNIRHPEVKRYDTQGYQSNIDISDEHEYKGQHGTGEEGQYFDEEVVDRIAETHDSTVYARLKLTCLIPVG